MRKLSHKAAVSTLRDTIALGEANATSGDLRLANEGRSNALIATMLLQVISAIPEDAWNSVKLVSYNKADLKDVNEEVSNLGDEPNHVGEE